MNDEYITKKQATALLCYGCSTKGDCRPGERCAEYMRIKEFPAADVQPVRHGRWRLYSPLTDTYECDKCGYQVIDESFCTNFCPDCGAKMERAFEKTGSAIMG